MKENKAYRILVWVLLILFASTFLLIAPLSLAHTDKDTTVVNTESTVETTVTEPPEVPQTTEVEEVAEPEVIETTTEEIVTEFVSYYDYTEYELDLLARLIYSESGGESYDTKLRVGSVVMNRVEDPHFPDTIEGVIYQSNQFSVTYIKINGVVMIDRPADEESYRAAKEILDYGSILPSTVQVFYATYCTEPWVTSRAVYDVCGNTVFAHIYAG